MTDNRALLEQLFETEAIDLQRGCLFDEPPAPLPAGFDWDRVDGMMLGLAIGDALGNTTESLLPARRRELYGEIGDYIPHRRRGTVATPTDDTQLAFWTLDQMLGDGGFVPERVARRFAAVRIFGIGSAVSQAMRDVRSPSAPPWYECGAASAGNGALMRIAPLLVPFVRSPSPDLWVDTALSAIITHNDAASTSACLAFVAMLWELLLGMEAAPEPSWWWRTYVAAARDLEGQTA
jgi:ADP-ribosyl-[dinitrogen reductase] hydrolase